MFVVAVEDSLLLELNTGEEERKLKATNHHFEIFFSAPLQNAP